MATLAADSALLGAPEPKQVDRRSYRLERDGQSQNLAPRELKLPKDFYCRPDEVLSRNDPLNSARGINYFGTRTLDHHIAQLRKKLEIRGNRKSS